VALREKNVFWKYILAREIIMRAFYPKLTSSFYTDFVETLISTFSLAVFAVVIAIIVSSV
jgi:hypothetical protein